MAISAATRFISAKRARSAKYTEWVTLGPLSRSRVKVASARDLLRATKMLRAPIRASASAAISPIPEVPPVMTTVLPFTSNLAGEAYSGLQSGLVMPS